MVPPGWKEAAEMMERMERLRAYLRDKAASAATRGKEATRRFYEIAQMAATVAMQFERNRGFLVASALTVTTLLALIPFTSVFFSIFSSFRAFEKLKNNMEGFLFRHLIASDELRDTISTYITNYTKATTQVSLLNLVALVGAVLLLFVAMEHAMNAIWRVKRRRGFLESMKAFTSGLVWGPLLLALSFYFTAVVEHYDSVRWLIDNKWMLLLFSLAVSWLMFFLCVVLLPNTTVEMESGLIGGFISAVMWELAKSGLEIYVNKAIFYQNIYGQMWVIPIFFLWLYFSWCIALLGAQIAYCHQNRMFLDICRDLYDEENPPREEMALLVFCYVSWCYARGSDASSHMDMVRVMGLPLEMITAIVDRL